MKIDMENVFVGTIKRCVNYETKDLFSSKTYIGDRCIGGDSFGITTYDSIIFKKNAVLLKVVTNGFYGYVDLNEINSYLDVLKAKKHIKNYDGSKLNKINVMTPSPWHENQLFVDESSLKQYDSLTSTKKSSVKKLKKEVLIDPRVPGGIDL